MQEYLVGKAGGHARVSFGPVIGYCVSEDTAVVIEGGRYDGAWCRVKCWERLALSEDTYEDIQGHTLFKRMRTSLSQKCIVPSVPTRHMHPLNQMNRADMTGEPYRKWRMFHEQGGMICRSQSKLEIGPSQKDSDPCDGI